MSGRSLVVSGAIGCEFQNYLRLEKNCEVNFLCIPDNGVLLKITGRPFTIETVKLEDLEKGHLTASWKLEASHLSIPPEQVEKMLKTVLIGTLLSSVKGAWDISDEFNMLLPDFKFIQMKDFLTRVWEGKP